MKFIGFYFVLIFEKVLERGYWFVDFGILLYIFFGEDEKGVFGGYF